VNISSNFIYSVVYVLVKFGLRYSRGVADIVVTKAVENVESEKYCLAFGHELNVTVQVFVIEPRAEPGRVAFFFKTVGIARPILIKTAILNAITTTIVDSHSVNCSVHIVFQFSAAR